MSRHQIQIEHQYELELDTVYEALADHNRLGRVLGVPCQRIQSGNEALNGAGSVRRIGIWPVLIEETVVDCQQGRFIDYRITRGGWPISSHRGHIQFSQNQGMVQVVWDIHFTALLRPFGFLVAHTLRTVIARGLARIH